MDISRLSHYGNPAQPPALRAERRETVLRVEPVVETRAAARPRVTVEQVIQGEVLERGRRETPATRDYLRGRLFDGAAGAGQGRRATAAYQAHTAERIQPGRAASVDYFV
ncbi:hypothetical protein QVG61_04295 [Thiohalobacter sp. IOR34]|uniref:hypothetical protein n=1 Tax=Thiohalobacter sp. IOR34 TaxID=3057176 RepID=UPI0025AFB594|nr:hypothetical protein [Thiohalobacter sp. IOR34]WJW76320.1 hypothetical protein QVG61_04295 [Thiohalobacter sp. IOR34]